ncbi:hypothetical protein OPQ81_005305 [Rhizoctonia solani]|nr:hypothetical protein OPQ81_005305 [Rhizoctonia solani]
MQILSSGVVLKIKYDADGKESHLKGCIVIHGNQQIAGLSYNDMFSNTPDLAFIRIVFVIIAHADLDCHMVDVTGTYMHAPIDQELYVDFPNGFGKGRPTVMKLKKALYGAHQSGCLWEHYHNDKITALGYCANGKDASIFTHSQNNIYSIIICYVNNFIIACTAGHIDSIKREILDLFDCKDLGKIKLFLGIAITHDQPNRKLMLSMESYIKNIVKMADLKNATSAHTPMSNMTPILEPAKITTEFLYITQLGHLFWIARTTRPKIAFAVSLLAHFSSCYRPSHIAILNCIHRYLKEMAHIGITYDMEINHFTRLLTQMPTLQLSMAENPLPVHSSLWVEPLLPGHQSDKTPSRY